MIDESFDGSLSALCPWCRTNEHLQMAVFGLSQFAVRCGKCKAVGPVGITREIATEDWNKTGHGDSAIYQSSVEASLYRDGMGKLAKEITRLQSSSPLASPEIVMAYKSAFAFLTGTAVGGMHFNLLLGKHSSSGDGLPVDSLKQGVYYRCISDESGVLSKGDLVVREGDHVVLFRDECRDVMKSDFPIGRVAGCRFALDAAYYRNVLDSYEPAVRKAQELLDSYGCCDWYGSYE